jgi:hypothetical protein
MTIQEFDNYKFSADTEVNNFKDFWEKIRQVDFYSRIVIGQSGRVYRYLDIDNIRN